MSLIWLDSEPDCQLFTASTTESREALASERSRRAPKDVAKRPDERQFNGSCCRCCCPTTQTPTLVQPATPPTMRDRHDQALRSEGAPGGGRTRAHHVPNTGGSPGQLPAVPVVSDVWGTDNS